MFEDLTQSELRELAHAMHDAWYDARNSYTMHEPGFGLVVDSARIMSECDALAMYRTRVAESAEVFAA